MEVKFGKWEKNGMKRVYVNGLAIGGATLWFQADKKGKLTDRNNTYGVPSSMTDATDKAYEALEAIIGPIPFDGIEFDRVFEAL
jgi:hypothetical protein